MYMAQKINPIVLLWLFFFTFAKNKNVTYYAIYQRGSKKKGINANRPC